MMLSLNLRIIGGFWSPPLQRKRARGRDCFGSPLEISFLPGNRD